MLPEDKNAHKAGNLTGYYYADTTGSAAKGLVPDVARMSKMADSLLGSSFGPAKVFDNWKALDQYNQHQAFNQQTATIKAIAMPMLAAAKSAAGKPLKLAGADTADSDAITSGGSRQIIIKDIHIGEKMVNHFTNVKEGAQQVGQVLKEELARIMLGLPGMQ